jgi:AbrB family looped-hinge helix DNA binding protein
MRLNSKGQVTIPAWIRDKHHLNPGDEVEVVEEGDTLVIVRSASAQSAGQRLVQSMRGRASTSMSTDELMGLLRDE